MALREDDEYRKRFNAAINARDDGDREDAAQQFKAMLELFPGDQPVIVELARVLIGLKDFAAADAHLLRALEADPANHGLREIWATIPFQECNWNEQIRRDEQFRASLPDNQKHLAKQSLIYTLAAYWESGRWPGAAGFIRAHRDAFTADPDTFGMAVQILGLLGQTAEIQALLDTAPPAAWSRLPPGAPETVRRRLAEAERNRALVQSTGIRVVSLGQHCLPYQLGARWGFSAGPVDADQMTPFDLGAFSGDSAAVAINTDFGAFADRVQFAPVRNWGGGSMYRHDAAGVHFHHERGPYWLENEGARFFARWDRMLHNWRQVSHQGRRLFVFCLVGEGDLNRLAEAADKHLLDRNSRLLVINVLKDQRHGPQHKRVAYLHAPYPNDYFWVELHNHASDRGYAFEKTVADAIRAQLMELDAEPNISDADYPEYRRLLDAAIDARDDGEPEDSAALLHILLGKFPADADATIEFVKTSRSLGKTEEAEQALTAAIAKNPNHFQLRKAWVDLPSFSQNWEESINRARTLRAAFPPPQYPQAWRSLEIEYDFLYDTGQWDVLSALIDANWENYKTYQNALPGGLGALNNLFLTDKLATLVDTAAPQAWQQMPDEAAGNLRLRAEMARQNLAAVAHTGVKIISIGQNCLPYLVGGRWGLLGSPADPLALQPFELGGFHNDNVAEAIDTDFAAFKDRDNYVITGAYGGGQMYTHQPSNVGFFHERGPWWMNDPSRFFARIDLMLANWAKIKTAGKRIFVFCYCGAGSLERLVEVADRHLLGPDSHLIIIDVLQEPHTPPPHERVSYVHTAYPRDYTWTKVGHQTTARGMAFELSIVNPIVALLAQFDPEQETTRAAAGQLRLLRATAQKARAAGQLENAASLFSALLTQAPEDSAAATELAQTLRDLKRLDEADAVLSRAIERDPENFALRKTWAEMPIHSADWPVTIQRGQALRASFPPRTQPHALLSLNAELSAYYDAGRWEDAVMFIHHNWESFTTRRELFGNALDMLGKLFRHHGVRDLLDAATPDAMQGFSAEALASLTLITDTAAENQKRLRASGAAVVSLGHNAHPYILAGRWGLNTGPAKPQALTPFDIGGFSSAATAQAIATDFAAFTNQADFTVTPTWFGGQMLVHQPTGINFLSHRRARWLDADRAEFFTHWEMMLANWRRLKNHPGRLVFVMNLSDRADLTGLVKTLDQHLLASRAGRPDPAHLVIIDQAAQANPSPVSHPRTTYIHAPPPNHYHWPRLTGCAHPIHTAYETRLLQAITAHIA